MLSRAGLLAVGLLLVPHAAHAEETVHVDLEGRTMRLERQTPGGWELTCAGTCPDEIPAGTYRLREQGKFEPLGAPFSLDPEHTANVSVGKNSLRPVMIVFGATGMITGGLAGLIGLVVRSPPHLCYDPAPGESCREPEPNAAGTAIAAIGGVVFLAGTVLLIGGVSQPRVLVSDRRTTTAVLPSWRTPEPSRVPTTTSALTFPLLSARF